MAPVSGVVEGGAGEVRNGLMSTKLPYEGTASMSVEVQFRVLLLEDSNVRNIFQFMRTASLRKDLPPWIWRMGQNSTGFSSSGSASPYLHFSLVIEEAHYSTPVEVILDFFTGWLKEQGIYGPVNVSKVTIDWRDPYERA